MNREQIEKWARSVGVEPGDEGFGIIVLAWQAGRAAALEEAKAVCEGRAKKHKTSSFKQAWLVAAECTDCAAAITALAEKEPQP
jgi:hypothetical protein